MNNFRTHLSTKAVENASPDDVAIMNEHWLSDLNFYKDELRFLKDLISKYLLLLTRAESIEAVKKMITDIDILEKEQKEISLSVAGNLKNIRTILQEEVSSGTSGYKEEHIRIGELIAEFYTNLMIFKRRVFTITEHVIESERLKHLLV
jgi:hypothetical protein